MDALRRIGFHFGEERPQTAPSSPAAFALAEHPTKVTLAPDLLEETTVARATVRIR